LKREPRLAPRTRFSASQIQRALDSEKGRSPAHVLVDPERVRLCQSYLSQAIELYKLAEETPGLSTYQQGVLVKKANLLLEEMMAATGLVERANR
jgi:hypothetical protein